MLKPRRNNKLKFFEVYFFAQNTKKRYNGSSYKVESYKVGKRAFVSGFKIKSLEIV